MRQSCSLKLNKHHKPNWVIAHKKGEGKILFQSCLPISIGDVLNTCSKMYIFYTSALLMVEACKYRKIGIEAWGGYPFKKLISFDLFCKMPVVILADFLSSFFLSVSLFLFFFSSLFSLSQKGNFSYMTKWCRNTPTRLSHNSVDYCYFHW